MRRRSERKGEVVRLRSGATEAKWWDKGGRYGLRDMQAEAGRRGRQARVRDLLFRCDVKRMCAETVC